LIAFSAYFGAGAVMGFNSRQVGCMSLWEFHVAFEGWRKANCPDDEGDGAPGEAILFRLIEESSR
jgi:hypothetical protein